MARITTLDTSAIAVLAAQFTLGKVLGYKSIAAGTVNSNYRVETDRGLFFLRVNEGKSMADVQYEADVLHFFVKQGIVTPLPRACVTTQPFAVWEGRYISVFPWIAGAHVDSHSISPVHCASLGAQMAVLHTAGTGVPAGLLRESRYSRSRIVEMFEGFCDSSVPGLQSPIEALYGEMDWLQSAESESGPSGLIHGDLFPDNVLMNGTDIVALLDFEQASGGRLAYDLAVAINAWCFAENFEVPRLQALLSAYASQCSFMGTVPELTSLWIELRASAVRFCVTRIVDVFLPQMGENASRSGEPSPGKDFRRFLMRLRTWQNMSKDQFVDLAQLALAR